MWISHPARRWSTCMTTRIPSLVLVTFLLVLAFVPARAETPWPAERWQGAEKKQADLCAPGKGARTPVTAGVDLIWSQEAKDWERIDILTFSASHVFDLPRAHTPGQDIPFYGGFRDSSAELLEGCIVAAQGNDLSDPVPMRDERMVILSFHSADGLPLSWEFQTLGGFTLVTGWPTWAEEAYQSRYQVFIPIVIR